MNIKLVKGWEKKIQHNKNDKWTVGRLFWMWYYSIKESAAMWHYVCAHRDRCEAFKYPTKKIRDYGIPIEHMNTEAWWILEKYYNGELIEKTDVQPIK